MNNLVSRLFSRIWSFLRRDFWRKLIALCFAFFTYFAVQAQLAGEQKLTGVPVEIRLPPELISVGRQDFLIAVNVKGPKSSLRNFDGKDLKGVVEVRLEDYVPGMPFKVRLHPSDFRPVKGVSVSSIDPQYGELVLNLQRRISRNVPVRPKFKGQLGKNYRRADVRCIPSETQVTGPEQLVRELQEISTQPIPLDDAVTESFEYRAQLEAPSGVMVSPWRATVQVDIVRNYERRIFQDMPLLLLSEPGGNRRFQVEVLDKPRVDVTVSGLAQPVSALRTGDVKVYLDISRLSEPGIYTLPVGCYVKGDSLDVREIYPEQIKVKITNLR